MNRLSILTVGWSVSALLAITYVACLIWDLVAPGWAMYQTWQGFFPGFGWSILGVVVGFIEAILYGFWVAVIFVPAYNFLHRREAAAMS